MSKRQLPKETKTETIHLSGWYKEVNDSIRALLFAQLVKRSGVIENYHSDLWHDARWIAEHVNCPITFYWAVCPWGTSIDTNRKSVSAIGENATLYRVDLTCANNGEWSATFTSED